MKMIDWLKMTDVLGEKAVYWVSGDEEFGPLWVGSIYDTPWYIADMELEDDDKKLDYEKPISYRHDLGEDMNHEHGFVITLKDADTREVVHHV